MVNPLLGNLLWLANEVFAHHSVAGVCTHLVDRLALTCIQRSCCLLVGLVFFFWLLVPTHNKALLCLHDLVIQLILNFDFLRLVFEHIF